MYGKDEESGSSSSSVNGREKPCRQYYYYIERKLHNVQGDGGEDSENFFR